MRLGRLIVAGLVLALVASACGSSETAGSEGDGTGSTTSVTSFEERTIDTWEVGDDRGDVTEVRGVLKQEGRCSSIEIGDDRYAVLWPPGSRRTAEGVEIGAREYRFDAEDDFTVIEQYDGAQRAVSCVTTRAWLVTAPFTPIDVSLSPAERAPSCADAARSGSLDELLSAFRAARVRGRGAEGCLTKDALASYCGPRVCDPNEFGEVTPGQICLYECVGHRVRDVDFSAARKRSTGQIWISASVTYEPEPAPGSPNEGLIAEVGAEGAPSGILLVEATSSA